MKPVGGAAQMEDTRHAELMERAREQVRRLDLETRIMDHALAEARRLNKGRYGWDEPAYDSSDFLPPEAFKPVAR